MTACAASVSPRWSSIIAPHQIWPTGFATNAKDRDFPETRGWHERAFALAQVVAGMRPDSFVAEIHGPSKLPCLRERRPGGDVFLIVHPLWRVDGHFGTKLSGGEDVKFLDTFNLERRPLRAIELAQETPT